MFRSFSIYIVLTMLISLNSCKEAGKDIRVEWQQGAELPAPPGQVHALGVAGALSGIHQNHLLIAGGANFPFGLPWEGGTKIYHPNLYVYSLGDGARMTLVKTDNLPFSGAYGASCSTPQGIVYVGGETPAGPTTRSILVQWDEKSKEVILKDLPHLPQAIANASAVYIGGRVYLAGGESVSETSSQFLFLDLENPEKGWNKLADIPKKVSHAVLVTVQTTAGEQLFLAGGRRKDPNGISELYRSLFAYDTRKGTWSEKACLPYAMAAGTGSVTSDGDILLFGGDRGETFTKVETLLAAISQETDPQKKDSLLNEKNRLQVNHPGFSRELLRYRTAIDQWARIGTIDAPVPVTAQAISWKDHFIIPSGEIRAGVRTPYILVGTLINN